MSWLFRIAGAVPIASAAENRELRDRAFEQIDAALARGDLVCIFPEGQITRTGELNEFRTGILRVLDRRPVTVIPMALTGLWGSFFSREGAGAMRHWPKPLVHRVTLRAGSPLDPAGLTVERLQDAVAVLGGAARSDGELSDRAARSPGA